MSSGWITASSIEVGTAFLEREGLETTGDGFPQTVCGAHVRLEKAISIGLGWGLEGREKTGFDTAASGPALDPSRFQT